MYGNMDINLIEKIMEIKIYIYVWNKNKKQMKNITIVTLLTIFNLNNMSQRNENKYQNKYNIKIENFI